MIIKIGTRGSALALWQANYVREQLESSGFMAEIVIIHTQGDKIQNIALSKIGTKGLFTQELEQALRNKEIDLAVHSAKDVPTEIAEDLPIIAYTQREHPADVFISHKMVSLEQKSPLHIGTSSTRRVAFLRHYYPQHIISDIRGNVQTRIKKLEDGQYDALLMAYAGIHRLGYDGYIREVLSVSQFVPAAGQGALAIQTHIEHPQKTIFKTILNHENTAICVQTERLFLQALGGGCSVPIFAYCTLQNDTLTLHAGIISSEGTEMASTYVNFSKTETKNLVKKAADEVLYEKRGSAILQAFRYKP